MDRRSYEVYVSLSSIDKKVAEDFLYKTLQYQILRFMMDDIRSILNIDSNESILRAVKEVAKHLNKELDKTNQLERYTQTGEISKASIDKVVKTVEEGVSEERMPKEVKTPESGVFTYNVKKPYESSKIKYKDGKVKNNKIYNINKNRKDIIDELEDLGVEYRIKDSTRRLQRRLDRFKSRRKEDKKPEKDKIIEDFINNKKSYHVESEHKKNIIRGWN